MSNEQNIYWVNDSIDLTKQIQFLNCNNAKVQFWDIDGYHEVTPSESFYRKETWLIPLLISILNTMPKDTEAKHSQILMNQILERCVKKYRGGTNVIIRVTDIEKLDNISGIIQWIEKDEETGIKIGVYDFMFGEDNQVIQIELLPYPSHEVMEKYKPINAIYVNSLKYLGEYMVFPL